MYVQITKLIAKIPLPFHCLPENFHPNIVPSHLNQRCKLFKHPRLKPFHYLYANFSTPMTPLNWREMVGYSCIHQRWLLIFCSRKKIQIGTVICKKQIVWNVCKKTVLSGYSPTYYQHIMMIDQFLQDKKKKSEDNEIMIYIVFNITCKRIQFWM